MPLLLKLILFIFLALHYKTGIHLFLFFFLDFFRGGKLLSYILLLFFVNWIERVMLGCGAVKYCTGDRSWRDGTAMHKHYYTQPLPNCFTHFFHRQPAL